VNVPARQSVFYSGTPLWNQKCIAVPGCCFLVRATMPSIMHGHNNCLKNFEQASNCLIQVRTYQIKSCHWMHRHLFFLKKIKKYFDGILKYFIMFVKEKLPKNIK
jgi:hypothetical protein